MSFRYHHKKTAFSFIEISIILLIVGLIVGAIFSGSTIVDSFRLSAARSKVKTSPVSYSENLKLWLEATSINSFNKEDANDGSNIDLWKDINSQLHIKHNLSAPASSNRPIYVRKAINNLPALRFNGSSHYLDASNINLARNSQLSIFIVMNRISQSLDYSGVISLWQNGQANDSDNLASLAIEEDTIANDNLRTFRTTQINATNHPGNNIPFIYSVIFDGSSNYSYINGVDAGYTNPSASSGNFNINNIRIGARRNSAAPGYYWNGYIGEIIIYDRALGVDERSNIESYLSQKWLIDLD